MCKVAVVHEWLVTYAGSEKALEQILNLFPDADLFCVIDYLPDSLREVISKHKVTTTFIQKLPLSAKYYRLYLPLMPFAISRLELSGYDVIISSSHAVAKGVNTHDRQIHISYTYSPMRYAWDLQDQYLAESNLDRGMRGVLAKWVLAKLREWDYKVAQNVDYFIAISRHIQKRILQNYGRESIVVYPPVDTNFYKPGGEKGDFYLTASRMVPYKMMSLVVSAFSEMPNRQLVVIGDGPEMEKIKQAAGNNVEILGYQDDRALRSYMQRAKCFIFAAEEDFGILPVEAQACGTPVVGYGVGGLLETVRGLADDSPTGVFFYKQDKQAIKNAVAEFEQNMSKFSAENCRNMALGFSENRFRSDFKEFVDNLVKSA
jgi:glycosyltransferase involved in cell wall biosynthesis